MDTELSFGDSTYRISLDTVDGRTVARIDDRGTEGEVARLTSHCFSVTLGNRRRTAYAVRSEDGVFVHVDGRVLTLGESGSQDRSFSAGAGAVGGGLVSSPMPGRVVKILVAEGQAVEKGEILVIVEAMKMENPLRSPASGTVMKVHYAEGDLVDAGSPIVEVEPADAPPE